MASLSADTLPGMAKKKPVRPNPEILAMVGRLEEIRKARGLTQEQAEEVAGVGSGTWSRWIVGDRLLALQLPTFIRLVKRFGEDPAYLLFGADHPWTTKRGDRPPDHPESSVREIGEKQDA